MPKGPGLAGRCTDRACILGPAHGWFNFMKLNYWYVDFLFALAHVYAHTCTVATEHAPSHNALTQQSVFFSNSQCVYSVHCTITIISIRLSLALSLYIDAARAQPTTDAQI